MKLSLMLPLLSASLLVACTPDIVDSGQPVNPGGNDTNGGGFSSGYYFEPELIGFELMAGWDEYRNELIGWTFNSSDYEPYLRIILPNRTWLDPRDDGFQDPSNVCELVASLDIEPADFPLELVEPFGEETPGATRSSYVGTLSVYGYDGGACMDFDPEQWQDGEPKYAFEGMRVGIAVGPMTNYLRGQWQEATIREYGKYMLASYFAINSYNDDGDLTFVGKDRSTSLVWQLGPDGELLVTDDVAPLGQDVSDPYLYAWLSGYAYYFENIDNIAFDRLTETIDQ